MTKKLLGPALGPEVSLTLSPCPTCDPPVLGQVSKQPQVPAKDA